MTYVRETHEPRETSLHFVYIAIQTENKINIYKASSELPKRYPYLHSKKINSQKNDKP